jgi:uncharacterized MAPEG superfamily protein
MNSSILPSLSVELAYLALSAPLALAYIMAQAVLAGGHGMRKAGEEPRGGAGGMGDRAEKALRNFVETFPVFAAMAIAVTLTGKADWWTGLGAALYFWGRVAYLPAYIAGFGPVRSTFWTVAATGIAIMFWQLAF